MLFISPSSLFTFSRYLNFCLDPLVIYKNGLIRKIRLISKFMKQTTTVHMWHGVKVGTGLEDMDLETRDPEPPSKFKKGALIITFFHCLTYLVLDKYI